MTEGSDLARPAESLAEFLQARRSRLTPGEVGLMPGRRRRVAGLRREEVAELAGIGASWYTALEQGRDVRPSDQVLISLARAFRLTPAETDHLFALAGRSPPPRLRHTKEETVSPAMHDLLAALDPNPAYIAGRRWDALAWNAAANAIFDFDRAEPPYPRNLLWRFFVARKRAADTDWERTALLIAASFRAEQSRSAGDPLLDALVSDLLDKSEDFRRIWSRHDVHDIGESPKVLNHPVLGALNVDHIPLQIPSMPGAWLMVHIAAADALSKLEAHLQGGDGQRLP